MKVTYGYNTNNLLKNDRPWFPVMGEMHYSRYDERFWEESLRKMKAGGLSIVSAYTIWIHHEEEEGVFDFSGCRDIRTFLRLCKKVGLSVFLRPGPFVHGEVRNGGFPDWLIEKGKAGMKLRCDDETYLAYVRRFWTAVYDQIRDVMEEDGPVIGIQIENEYGHVGGLRGPEGEKHMRTLTAMARKIGFCVPLYTATGWGGACIGDLLPVMGGYCEAPWDQRTCELEPNSNFVFSHIRNDELIASDHHIGNKNTYREADFPFLTAELGGGLQVTSHRRPVARGKDIGAMSTVKLGSGAALLGYYMYHGGSNPKGRFSTLQESRETGYLNDLPEINYDFNAPIRQYGTISDSYREIKLLALFLKDFGEDLAVLRAEIPSERILPGDMDSLRTSCRHDAEHGYVFFNNYQRRMHMREHRNVELIGKCGGIDEDNGSRHSEQIIFPKMDIKEGMYGFFPYRMKLGNAVLRSALATPLCRLNTKDSTTYVFYGEQEPQFQWEGKERADVLSLTRKEALHAWKVSTDQDYLVLSEDYVWEEDGSIKVTGGWRTEVMIYPDPEQGISGFTKQGEAGRFSIYERVIAKEETEIEAECVSVEEKSSTYRIRMTYPALIQGKSLEKQEVHDIMLHLAYAGERLEIFVGKEKINDHFYTGQEVPIRLGYFDFPEELTVIIYGLHETDEIFMEERPAFELGYACELKQVKLTEWFY